MNLFTYLLWRQPANSQGPQLLTLNVFLKAPREEIGWHVHGEEVGLCPFESLKGEDLLLFEPQNL